jgi:hypothetical protein
MTPFMTKQSIPMPGRLDDHPDVRRHAEKLRTLEEKATRATTQHASLVAERAELQKARHHDDVTAALGDGAAIPADRGRAARLATLDTEIDRAGQDLSILQDALEVHTALGETIRADVTLEIAAQAEQAIRAVYKRMGPLAEDLSILNEQLIGIAEANGLQVPAAALFRMWHEQLRAGGR